MTGILPQIDFSSSSISALSQRSLSILSSVYVDITQETLQTALSFLPDNFGQFNFTANVTSLSLSELRQVLNAGASKIVVTRTQFNELQTSDNSTVDASRLILAADVSESGSYTSKDLDQYLDNASTGIYISSNSTISITEWLQALKPESRPPIYIATKSPTLEKVLNLIRSNVTVIVSSEFLTTEPKDDAKLLPVAKILYSALKSDRTDGLISTLVVDEQGIALGLVYSNEESLTESLRTATGVYMSRKRGLWYKGATSGATQELMKIDMDCDADCLRFVVRQKGKETMTCFGKSTGLTALQQTLQSRRESAPQGSYTARLFSDPALLRSKIMEEAEELCDATTKEHIAFEAADLLYFALAKCVSAGVTLADIERNLDAKSLKVERRKGDSKPKWTSQNGIANNLSSILESAKATAQATLTSLTKTNQNTTESDTPKPQVSNGVEKASIPERIQMRQYDTRKMPDIELETILQRPSQRSTEAIMGIVQPIIAAVRQDGDEALLSYTRKFDRCPSLQHPVLLAPFPQNLMQISPETKAAIDLSYDNIYTFHKAQKEDKPLSVDTMPGVRCSRFSRPIERVGLYVPGGTAVLPSTALMLGVPALVAGCKTIVLASPPRTDGSITPEIVYIAHKVGATAIVLAGGAQAVAALAYGTKSVPKVDKILGPGNQFVTAAKMIVSNDTSAGVSIDMPAGPSEVLVIADKSANPIFVASDLLSQAEHGVDSQVVLISVDLDEQEQKAIEDELHKQAMALPRVDIVKGAIEHSVTLSVDTMERAFDVSNLYAPEHLILQIRDARQWVDKVQNAGSVFIGEWTPESVGDYSAGVNHSLPTYGYAKQYSGVNLATFVKHITSSELTAEGLKGLGGAVMELAKVEGLDAHGRAVGLRLEYMAKNGL